MQRRLFAAVVLLGLAQLSALPAWAVSGDDQAAIQTVISGQISAFRRDDGPAAYSAASPAIQSRFQSVDLFMAMVAGQYQPVYRPQSMAFGQLVDTAAGPVQSVFLVGPDGVGYVAQYLLEQQPDGAWKINGVAIVKDSQPSI